VLRSSGRRGIRTLTPLRAHSLATRPGQPYPATFRFHSRLLKGPPGSRTRTSSIPGRCAAHRTPADPPGTGRSGDPQVELRVRESNPSARLMRPGRTPAHPQSVGSGKQMRRDGVEPPGPGRERGLQPRGPCQCPTGASSRALSSALEWPRRDSNPHTPASEAGGFASLPTGPWSVPGGGIEPPASWFRAGRHDQPQLLRIMFSDIDTFTSDEVRGGGFEPPQPASKAGGLPLADPRSVSRASCGARTRVSGVEGRCLAVSAKDAKVSGRPCSGRGGSRTPKAHRSAVFETAAIAHWLALPDSGSSARRSSSPHLRPREDGRLPLHHGHVSHRRRIVKDLEWDPRGSNPHLPG
jgi:hypothetical protein